MALIRGIDISAYQSVESWAQVAKAVDFCVVKATQRHNFLSSTFRSYYAASRSAGLLTGSYHFAEPNRSSAAAQAAWYVKQLKAVGFKSGRDLPPVLDIESTGGKSKAELTTWCLGFVQEVDRLLGLKTPWLRCGVYMNDNFHDNMLDGPRLLAGRWLWLASWPAKYANAWPPESARPTGAAMWQFTDKVSIAGLGRCDGDVARVADVRSLAPFHFGGVTPAPEPTQPEDTLAGITLAQIEQSVTKVVRKVVHEEVNAPVKPGPGAQRIAGDYSDELIKHGDRPAAYGVGADARTRALVRAVAALAAGMNPAVQKAVEAALKDAGVDADAA